MNPLGPTHAPYLGLLFGPFTTHAFTLKGRRSQCALAHALLAGCPDRSRDLWPTRRHITSLAHLLSESDESPLEEARITSVARSRVLGTCHPLEICAVLGTCLPLEVHAILQ